jgi:hypothetical protein
MHTFDDVKFQYVQNGGKGFKCSCGRVVSHVTWIGDTLVCEDCYNNWIAEQKQLLDMENGFVPDEWDIFADRAKSLIQRWWKFRDTHRNITSISKECIEGFLAEINDEFTKQLLK